ncbi:MAG: DUF3592 domain-containing protein [Chloroflexi bacterium]|nr:DUF3592 domain-containing protein [Chloroflexota bacterium]
MSPLNSTVVLFLILMIVPVGLFSRTLLLADMIRQKRPVREAVPEWLNILQQSQEGGLVTGLRIATWLVPVLGLVMIAQGVRNFYMVTASEDWPETNATLIEVGVVEYVVEDVTYQSDRLALPNVIFGGRAGEGRIDDDAPGRRVTIAYNPSNPAQAVVWLERAREAAALSGVLLAVSGLSAIVAIPFIYVRGAAQVVPEAHIGQTIVLRVRRHNLPPFLLSALVHVPIDQGTPSSSGSSWPSWQTALSNHFHDVPDYIKPESGDDHFDEQFAMRSKSPQTINQFLQTHHDLRASFKDLSQPVSLMVTPKFIHVKFADAPEEEDRLRTIDFIRQLSDRLTST